MADSTNFDFFFNLSTHSRPVKRFFPLCLHFTIPRCVPCMIASIAGLMDRGLRSSCRGK